MEYVLDSGKWTYFLILFGLFCVLFFIADIKFKIYKIDMIQKAFGLTDNQSKFISTIFIMVGVGIILFLYSEFISIKITNEKVILKYPKPRPTAVITNNLIDYYEIKIPQIKKNRGLMIYLTNGKKYKSVYVGHENRDVFNKLIEHLDTLIRKNKTIKK